MSLGLNISCTVPFICSNTVGCLVSYSAPTAWFLRSTTTSPTDLSDSILSVIPVSRSLTVVRSSFMASPATADGARFFLAGGREGGRRGDGEGGLGRGGRE